MKIVDIGICVDNIDPKGIGRIRYRPYSLFVSEIERGVRYEKWDEMDPFIALPFLPVHINIIPQIQQSIKLIRYDSERETQNVEYIGGPYTSPHDTQNQTFATQHINTTFGGVIIKDIKDIRNKDGDFTLKVSKGTIIKNEDTGFRGNYGSDLIFTENGVQIRGGLLLSKKGKDKEKRIDYPHLAKKMGRLSLKKFPTTFNSVTESIQESEVGNSRLKYIIEYEIDDLSTPTQLKLFAYKVMSTQGQEFNTNTFTEDTIFSPTDILQVYLINTGFTLTDATYIKSLDGTISSAYIELRELLYLLDHNNLTALHYGYPNEDIHPFYFKPTSDFRIKRGENQTEIQNKELFISKVQLRNKSNGSGLIFSRENANPPVIINEKTKTIAREIKNSGEQSFSSLSADKVYILSTSPNIGVNVKSVNFNNLDEYELTQENYIADIEPNTQPMVRGETLYNIIIGIKNLLDSHIHNINEPLVKTDENWVKLNELIETMRDDLLNESIRIN